MPHKPKKFHFIYKTTNNVTGRYYVGVHSTDDINDGYLGSGLVLRRSVKRYGREAHNIEILEHCSSRDELKQRETEVVNEELLDDPLCMNLKTGGEGGSDFQTAATRQKISLSKRGKKHYWSDAARQKLALYRTGRKHTDETRAKVSRARKGSSVTEEVRSKISASMKVLLQDADKREKRRANIAGRHFYNDGQEVILVFDTDPRLTDPKWKRGKCP